MFGSARWVFFFQAEDGIRDLTVTGVQTCALPISIASGVVSRLRRRRLPSEASRAARSSRQTTAGRSFTPHPAGGRWTMVEVRKDGEGRAEATSTNLHQPPQTSTNFRLAP